MKKTIKLHAHFLTLLLICCVIASTKASASKAPTIIPRVLFNIVDGASALSIPKIIATPTQSWYLIRITPNTDSGDLTSNAYIDADTGINIIPKILKMWISVSGKYEILQIFGLKSKATTGQYVWHHSPNLEQGYNNNDFVFISQASTPEYTNYIVCQLDQKKSGQAFFQNTYWIPSDWSSYVLPSIQFYRQNQNALSEDSSNANIKFLAHIASSNNPLTAITAIEILLQKKALTKTILSTSFKFTGVLRTAIVINLLSQDGWLKNSDNAIWLQHQIIKAHLFDFLAGVAIGLFVAKNDEEYNRNFSDNTEQRLISIIDKNIKSIKNISNAQREYRGVLNAIYSRYGLVN